MAGRGEFSNERDEQCHSFFKGALWLVFVVLTFYQAVLLREDLKRIDSSRQEESSEPIRGPFLDVCEDTNHSQADGAFYAEPSVLSSLRVFGNFESNKGGRHIGLTQGSPYSVKAWRCVRFDVNSTTKALERINLNLINVTEIPANRITGGRLLLQLRFSFAEDSTNAFAFEEELMNTIWWPLRPTFEVCKDYDISLQAAGASWSDSLGGRRGAPVGDTFFVKSTTIACGKYTTDPVGVLRFNVRVASSKITHVVYINDVVANIQKFVAAVGAYTAILGWASKLFPVMILPRAFAMHIPSLGLGVSPDEQQPLMTAVPRKDLVANEV